MSDVRKAAEDRRAKILARQNSKKVSAIGDVAELPVEGGPVERPLAKRKQYLQAVAETVVEKNAKVGDADEFESKTEQNDPIVESISEFVKSQKCSTNSLNEDGKADITPKKTMKELELEIAENTAKFDESTQSSKENKPKIVIQKSKKEMVNNIQPANVMRFVRLLVILSLGALKGYQVVQNNNAQKTISVINTSVSASSQVIFESTDEFSISAGSNVDLGNTDAVVFSDSQREQQRTWLGWIHYKLSSPFDSTITAVGISWWIASMFESSVMYRFSKAPAQPKNILDQIMSLYQNGFEGILERVFCTLGEYALHLGTILVVVTLLTLLTEIPTTAVINNITSSTTDSSDAIITADIDMGL